MATTEQILTITDCQTTFGVSERLVRAHLTAGKMAAWRDARGRWLIPASAAEKHLGPYRGALSSTEAATLIGVTESAIFAATVRGDLERIPPPNGGKAKGRKAAVYIRPESLEAWRKRRRGAKPAQTPTTEATPAALPLEPATKAPLHADVDADHLDALERAVLTLSTHYQAMAKALAEQAKALTALATATQTHGERNERALLAFTNAVQGLSDWVGELAVAQAKPLDLTATNGTAPTV